MKLKKDRKLFFLTQSFPYGSGEQFIESELPFLEKTFSEIIIIPFSHSTTPAPGMRQTTSNTLVRPPVQKKNKLKKYIAGLFNTVPCSPFYSEMKRVLSNPSLRVIRQFITDILLTRGMLSGDTEQYIRSHAEPDDIIYAYWGFGCAFLFPFIADLPCRKIVRLHGSDLYEHVRPPFMKNTIFSTVDEIIIVSQNGKNYLGGKYPDYYYKMHVFRLGTNDHGVAKSSNDGILRIVSCSNMKKIKRIDKIVNALKHIDDIRIQWTHIGDGPERNSLEHAVRFLPASITVHFTGNIQNSKVFSFYRNNPTDLFINTSENEGLPVSIMEAISFGIPVIATDVGGTNEIITKKAFLLPQDFTSKQLAEKIQSIHHTHPNKSLRSELRNSWKNNFSASKNHTSFVSFLSGKKDEE